MRQEYRKARCYRSMLFVPGVKYDWMIKGPKYGPDAVILDLEASVPVAAKDDAREAVRNALSELRSVDIGRFVRINDWQTGHTLQDVLAVTVDGLDGIVLSRTEDVDHVTGLDLVLADLEKTRGLPAGHVEIIPLCSTA